ncbi:acyl-CoA N-acyltransferase [Cadophora sp. MPI-SDFR-AT-0126]|nr:acyl-CoA N-acyltransferase [Leotiomycetes sp. MPI-SDFR-AT-0126]
MDQSDNQPTIYHIRPATLSDTEYILSLATRVQAALTASGSLQELTPSTLDTIRVSIHNEEILIFTSIKATLPAHLTPTGSVTISPFSPSSGHGSGSWEVDEACGKTWFLHSLMLEPSLQGNGVGKTFLKEALKTLEQRHGAGTLVLDCWAGNEKLREFYEEVGFDLVGLFPEEEYEIAVYKISVGA